METIIYTFLLFNLIENLLIVLLFLKYNNINEKLSVILLHTIMLSTLNSILQLIFVDSLVVLIIGITIICVYFKSIYYTKWYKTLVGVIIPFSILVTIEIVFTIVYMNIWGINLGYIFNNLEKFIFFIPIRVVEFLFLLVVKKILKKRGDVNEN